MNTLRNPKNSIENPNQLNKTVKSEVLKPDSGEISQNTQSLSLISQVSNLMELDKIINEEDIIITEDINSFISENIIQNFFNIGDLNQYCALESQELKVLISNYINQMYDSEFTEIISGIDKSIFKNHKDDTIVNSIVAKIKGVFQKADCENILAIINTLGFNFFSERYKSKFISNVFEELNTSINKQNPSQSDLSNLILAEPELLDSLPENLLCFILDSIPSENLNVVITQLIEKKPQSFNSIINYFSKSSIHVINEDSFNQLFHSYFKEDTFLKVKYFIAYLEDLRNYKLLAYISKLVPTLSFAKRIKFKMIQKKGLIQEYGLQTVELFESLFIKKNANLDIQHLHKLPDLFSKFFNQEIQSIENNEFFDSAKKINFTPACDLEKVGPNEVKFNIYNERDLNLLISFLEPFELDYQFQNDSVITFLDDKKITISGLKSISGYITILDVNDYDNYINDLIHKVQNFDFKKFESQRKIQSLDLFSLKLNHLFENEFEAYEALRDYPNKEFLVKSGVLLNIFAPWGPNCKTKYGRKFYKGKELGSGSFGSVSNYLVKLNGKYMIVALKELVDIDDENLIYGFKNEVLGSRARKQIVAPNLIDIYSANVNPKENDFSIIMETGQDSTDLEEAILDEKVTAQTTLDYLLDSINGIETLWQNGFCHLDFKPGNVVVFKDQFTGQQKCKIIDLNLPKIDNLLNEVWYRTVELSFSKHFAMYLYLSQTNACNDELNRLNLSALKEANGGTLEQSFVTIYNNFINSSGFNQDEFKAFNLKAAKANDTKALIYTLLMIWRNKSLPVQGETLDFLNQCNNILEKSEILKGNPDSPIEEVIRAMKEEFEFFSSPNKISKLKEIINLLKTQIQEGSLESQNITQPLRISDLKLDQLSHQGSGQTDVTPAPEFVEDSSIALKTQVTPAPEVVEKANTNNIEDRAYEDIQGLQEDLVEDIPAQQEILTSSDSETQSTLVNHNPETLQSIIGKYLSISNPTEEDFNGFMGQINTVFEQRNGQKQSFKRKLKNFVFGKVPLKTKLKAAAISISAGAILSSKAILSATGLATIVGASPVMPIVLMTVFFKTCSASSLSTIFTKRRLKKLLKDDNFDSRIVKLFYYAKQAVGNEDDIQNELDINLKTLKDGGTLTIDQIQTSLKALSKNSNQDKIKDFLGGLGLSALISSAIYYGLTYEPVANFIQDKIKTLKSWLLNIFESNQTIPVKHVSTSQLAQKPTPSPDSSSQPTVEKTTPDSSVVDNTPKNQLPEVSTPEISTTQGFIPETGNASDTIQINSNGSRVHMRGPNGENLTNRFGFNRYWNARNPIVRVDLSDPKIVDIDGEKHVIYQTLLKGKLSGRWISGTMIGGK